METILSLAGIAGALCCVGMYAAVSLAWVSAERPIFFIVNGAGALLVMVGAAHSFDLGDVGTIGQELIWVLVSALGFVRALRNPDGALAPAKAQRFLVRAAARIRRLVRLALARRAYG